MSGVVALVYNQVNLLLNFVQSLIILSLKKFRVVTQFFKGKKNHKILYIIMIFFLRSGWSCDHPSSSVAPPVDTTTFGDHHPWTKYKLNFDGAFLREVDRMGMSNNHPGLKR